jgi:hypothetical protein
MQIKTTLRVHLITIRLAIIKKTNNKGWWGCKEKWTLVHYWWKAKLVQAPWKSVCRLLKKLKLDLPYDLAIPLLGLYPKKCELIHTRDTCIPVFIEAVFTVAKLQEQPTCPTRNEWIKNMHIYIHIYVIYTYMIYT